MNWRKRWRAAALSVQVMLENFAVIGAGIAAYEQKIWPALIIGLCAAIFAIGIAMVVSND